MPTRPATKADIPAMGRLVAAAFGPDALFQAIFPFQAQYPGDFERALRENLWVSWFDYAKVMVVSYKDEDSRGSGGEGRAEEGGDDERRALIPRPKGEAKRKQIITGVAEWERVGLGASRMNGLWGRWDPRRLLKPLVQTFFTLRRLLFLPNRASIIPTPQNPSPLTYWQLGPALGPFMTQFTNAPHRATHWTLEILGVDPQFQGQGYGRELVEQGLSVARDDPLGGGDLPACVMAADGKEGFYQKCGFKELVGWVCEAVDEKGRENPLRSNGVGGGAVLWTR